MEPVPEQALDIQHDTDPAPDHGPARRIPHLGHALLFLSLIFTCVLLCSAVVFTAAHCTTEEQRLAHPGYSLIALALGYIVALALAAWVFPRLWARPFLAGIQWNILPLARRWYYLVPTAVFLSLAAQYSERFFPTPDDPAMTQIMHTLHGAWLTTLFGVLIAPLLEEMTFRGFLLPAFATAYDWLALDRTPAGLERWERNTGHTAPALVFAAIFSSIGFAFLHADQLSYSWGALSILFAVSLVLSFVRVRMHSLACSVFVHSLYNLTIFVGIFIQTGAYRHLDRI